MTIEQMAKGKTRIIIYTRSIQSWKALLVTRLHRQTDTRAQSDAAVHEQGFLKVLPISSSSSPAPRLKRAKLRGSSLKNSSLAHTTARPRPRPIRSQSGQFRLPPPDRAFCMWRARARAARSASRTPTAVRFFWRLGKFSPVRAHVFFFFLCVCVCVFLRRD